MAGARNIISGNVQNGLSILGDDNRVEGNSIGTNASGAVARPNGWQGISLSGTSNRLGGPTASSRNFVAGNGGSGIFVSGPSSTNNEIASNYVGIASNGTSALPNGQHGVWLAGAPSNVIGGSSGTPGAAPGNVISGNSDSGVFLSGAGPNTVNGNLIGTNAAGTAAVPNEDDGVTILAGARAFVGNTARNVISGNGLAGVLISDAGSNSTALVENFVGLNRAGTAAVPNGTGVEITDGARFNDVGSSGSGVNVISGNRHEGVLIHGAGTSQNTVFDNLIGLRADGASAIPNGKGVVIAGGAKSNTVGGAIAGRRNTISGNRVDGVLITGAGSDRNVVRGNSIGTSPGGTAAIPNLTGVHIAAGARSNTVGGPRNAPLSLISGNTAAGVRVAGVGTLANRVQGNYIGTGPGGFGPMPNGTGVLVTASAESTTIGGAGALGNRIGQNAGSGVVVDGATTTGAEITQNAIFANGGLGINLVKPGEPANAPTPNDAGDPDTGPNALQNFPVIAIADATAGSTTIAGTLNSVPSGRFRVEVFRNPPGTTGTAAEGETFVAADTTVVANASGNATWSVTVPSDLTGHVIKATATKLDVRNTSELSAAAVAN